jgi:hypothetical protein
MRLKERMGVHVERHFACLPRVCVLLTTSREEVVSRTDQAFDRALQLGIG